MGGDWQDAAALEGNRACRRAWEPAMEELPIPPPPPLPVSEEPEPGLFYVRKTIDASEWEAKQAREAEKPVHQVLLSGLPNTLLSDNMMDAMLEQNGLKSCCRTFKASPGASGFGQVLLSLEDASTAHWCYYYFHSCRWGGAEVTAELLPPPNAEPEPLWDWQANACWDWEANSQPCWKPQPTLLEATPTATATSGKPTLLEATAAAWQVNTSLDWQKDVEASTPTPNLKPRKFAPEADVPRTKLSTDIREVAQEMSATSWLEEAAASLKFESQRDGSSSASTRDEGSESGSSHGDEVRREAIAGM